MLDPISVTLQDGATIAVNSQGTGEGGNIEIQAGSLSLNNGATILAETTSNQGGNITLNIDELLLLRHGSKISTTAGTDQAGGNGGNITINADYIVGVRQEDSDITANAFKGNGGRINITAQGIFGLEFRSHLTPLSDITASSELGVDGVVELNLPDVDPSRGLNPLPDAPVNPQFNQGCQEGGGSNSRFINAGRGGSPTNPYEPLNSNDIWEDVQPPTQEGNRSNDSAAHAPIVEAQGWIIDEKGEVILVAQMPDQTPQRSCRLH